MTLTTVMYEGIGQSSKVWIYSKTTVKEFLFPNVIQKVRLSIDEDNRFNLDTQDITSLCEFLNNISLNTSKPKAKSR